MPPKTGITEGNDLMVYIDKSNGESSPTWSATLHATSHSISWGAETKTRKTKSTGLWGNKKVTGLSCTIKVDALRSYDEGIGLKELKAMMLACKEVKIKSAYVTEETGDTYDEGLFVITSIDEGSPAGEDATYSATFENSGAVDTKTKEAGA